MNEYEAERARKIAENKARLQELGLLEHSKSFKQLSSSADAPGHRYRNTKSKQKVNEAKEPLRSSKRLRGGPSEVPTVITHEAEETARTSKEKSSRKVFAEPNENTSYCAPFTIASTSTTIQSLGEIYRGPWCTRFWSSSSCAYHHAYPIGYTATKKAFGRKYEMRIEAGTTNPIFIVTDQSTGRQFKGNSPTAPWTDICIAQNTGQRISGPLFFGFSDPVTQAAVASLYNERERRAAAVGESVEPEELSTEEKAAKEFQKVQGIGDSVAMVLALTTTFGGMRHISLQSLQTWVRASKENADRMKNFLLTSEELSSATKKWPAWRSRLVPKIMAALCSDNSEDGIINAMSDGSGNKESGKKNKKAGGAGAMAKVDDASGGQKENDDTTNNQQ